MTSTSAGSLTGEKRKASTNGASRSNLRQKKRVQTGELAYHEKTADYLGGVFMTGGCGSSYTFPPPSFAGYHLFSI